MKRDGRYFFTYFLVIFRQLCLLFPTGFAFITKIFYTDSLKVTLTYKTSSIQTILNVNQIFNREHLTFMFFWPDFTIPETSVMDV